MSEQPRRLANKLCTWRHNNYAPARCTPDAAAQLQPIPSCGAQRALLPIAVAVMNNELLNINDVRESATIFPRPCKLTFGLLTLKVVSDSRVMATCVPILVFLGLSVLASYSRCTRQRDRQTSDSIIA